MLSKLIISVSLLIGLAIIGYGIYGLIINDFLFPMRHGTFHYSGWKAFCGFVGTIFLGWGAFTYAVNEFRGRKIYDNFTQRTIVSLGIILITLPGFA